MHGLKGAITKYVCAGLACLLLPAPAHCQVPSPIALPNPPVPVALTGPPSPPPLGRKLEEVVALRTILSLHLTARDIDAVLPTLRDLQQAEQTLEEQAEQDIDTERRALLVAGPDAPTPPDSSVRISEDLARYRQRQDDLWGALAIRVGSEKAEGLRRMIGPPPPPGIGPRRPGLPPNPALPDAPLPGGRHKHRPPVLEPHLALPDLIALLQQKRSAMPH